MAKARAETEAAGEMVPPGSLIPWERNPRRNEAAVAEVARSIKRYGFGSSVVAQKSSRRIIAGHTRVEAAKRLGLDLVPVRFLDLDDAEATRLALADNKLGEIAQWDIGGLMSLEADGFDLQEVGWSELELREMELAESPAVSSSATFQHSGKAPVKRSTVVSVAILVEDTEPVERALDAAAGSELSRGQALRKICEAYLAAKA